VLVAPLLGPRSQNQIGNLARPGGLDQFIARVMDVLRAQAGLRPGAQVTNIIMACHSGGGLAMRMIARAQNSAASLIRECWGFDCTYNHDDAVVWGDWARKRSNARLYMFYLANTRTAIQALQLQRRGIPNVRVVASRARGHNHVPHAHFAELLRASPVLRNR